MSKLFRATAVLSVLVGVSAVADAADLHVKAPPRPAPPPVVVPPPFSWSGFYVGGNLGAAWSHRSLTDSRFGLQFDNGNNNATFVGGGQVGFNYQINNFVLGAEGDFDWAAKNSNTGTGVFIPTVGTIGVTSNNRWISSLAARFGVAVDRLLFYGKAGGGWVGADGFTLTNSTGASFLAASSRTDSGWLAGGGVEWAITDAWSARLEYDYLGLGNRTFTVPLGSPILPNDTFTTHNRNVQMATVGINYRFNWGAPFLPRY
jgi:outer membrane immunogenic protein